MDNLQKNQTAITEADVVFYDIDPVLYGEKARIRPTPSSEWIWFDCFDFLHWLVDINRLDYFDSDACRVSSYGCSDTADSFWRDLAISKEGDKLLNEYLTAEELAQTQAA